MGPEGCIHPGRPAEDRLCTGSAAYLNEGTDMLANAAQRGHDSGYYFTEEHLPVLPGSDFPLLMLPFVSETASCQQQKLYQKYDNAE